MMDYDLSKLYEYTVVMFDNLSKENPEILYICTISGFFMDYVLLRITSEEQSSVHFRLVKFSSLENALFFEGNDGDDYIAGLDKRF